MRKIRIARELDDSDIFLHPLMGRFVAIGTYLEFVDERRRRAAAKKAKLLGNRD